MTHTTIQIIAVIIFVACNAGAVYLMFAEKKEDANKLSNTGLICFLSLLLVAMSIQIKDLHQEIEAQDIVIAYYEHQYKTNKPDSNEVQE